MSLQSLVTTIAAGLLAGVTALTGTTSVAPSHEAPASVCRAVPRCHVVAVVDMDGDARADQVGWRQLTEQSVQIRVARAAGTMLTRTVDVSMWWGGGAWGGAARVDHRAGAELLVGSMQGAHTPMYTMLTYRPGGLVVERSPSPLSHRWQVDAAFGDYMGWWRHTGIAGRTTVTQKIAVRSGSGSSFSGRNVTYVWSTNRWERTATRATTYPTAKAASVIAGFHVPGLGRFPGVG